MEITKVCFKCEIEKPLSDYYKHKQMGDGHLNKCKVCTKKDTADRVSFLMETQPDFQEKERARHRDKYYRLEYKEKHKPSYEKKKEAMDRYKEKYPEKNKAKNAAQRLSCIKGNHIHHWSYNEEHWKDCIELSKEDHAFLHRFIKYDQERMMYRNLDGILLDTKQSHSDLLLSLRTQQKDNIYL